MASSMAALSRTDRVTTCSVARPCHTSPTSGPVGVRPGGVLSANRPQPAPGIRSDPPPPPPPASGTIRAATAAAEPPLDPPGVRLPAPRVPVGPQGAGLGTGRG